MKKLVKKLAALTLVLGLSLCLCSCVDLDEIRQTRAVYLNEQHTEVEFRDNTYKQLDKKISDYLSSYSFSSTAYAVESEVPLLLTEQYGKWVDYSSADTRLISVEGVYYCRNDLYNYAKKIIEKNEFKYTCVEIYDHQNDKYTTKMLDNSIIDTVDTIIASVQPLSEYPDTNTEVQVMATDEKALFMHNLFYVSTLVDGGYFISMDNLADDIYGYVVPKKYEAEFEDLFPEQTEFEDYNTEEDFQIYL